MLKLQNRVDSQYSVKSLACIYIQRPRYLQRVLPVFMLKSKQQKLTLIYIHMILLLFVILFAFFGPFLPFFTLMVRYTFSFLTISIDIMTTSIFAQFELTFVLDWCTGSSISFMVSLLTRQRLKQFSLSQIIPILVVDYDSMVS